MPHLASRWPLALIAAVTTASLGRAQDPTPVAYWSLARPAYWGPATAHAAPAPIAPTYPPYAGAPTYPPYAGRQLSTAPSGQPEAGVQAPFIIPPGAPHGHGRRFGHGQLIHHLFANHPFQPRPPILNDSLPTHPYARSPRDFFMFYENLEAERWRDLRPTIVP